MRSVTFLLISLLYINSCANSTLPIPESCEEVEWAYTGSSGPSKWAELCVGYGECGGSEQSPINITSSNPGTGLAALTTTQNQSTTYIINNGHTIEFVYDEGSSLQWKGESYTLKQFHFHASSEHQVQSNSYPMEMHLVHQNAAGKLAVIGIFFSAGAENQLLKKFEPNYPQSKESFYKSSDRFTVADLFPTNKGYYTYNGSLTTPPCTEGVTWIVMKEPISASLAQIQKISSIMKQNNRPVQKLNSRQVQSYN